MKLVSSDLGHARNANVAKFRIEHIRQHAYHPDQLWGDYNGVLHFVTLNLLGATVALYSLYHLITDAQFSSHFRGGLLTMLITFLFDNTVEYCLHRFDMHSPDTNSDHSSVHHRYFTSSSMFLTDFNREAHTILFSIGFIFRLFYLVLPILGMGLNALFFPTCGYYFLFVSASYYLQYEWLHLIYHSAPDSLLGKLPFVHILRANHRVHHYQPLMREFNFNITYPVADLVWKTLYWGKPVYDQKVDMSPPPKFTEKELFADEAK